MRRTHAILRVSDNEPGISSGNLERVFEPFFTTARERGGTGMGLAIARSPLRAYGGKIEVQAGVGATFELRLPPVRGLA
jgi:two-component system OmpR family sensor kinase